MQRVRFEVYYFCKATSAVTESKKESTYYK